jgi:hypothetical protein
MTDDIRSQVVTYGRTLAGLSADPAWPFLRGDYLDTIAPGETPSRANEMAKMSGCALTCRAILRRFIRHPILEAPYRDRQAVSDLMRIAQGAEAVTVISWPDAPRRPDRFEVQPGDMLIVGGGLSGDGSEHAWTVLDVVADPGYEVSPGLLVTGLDGGQRDAGGHQLIALRDHEIRDGWDVTSTGRRRIRYVLDVAAIVTRFGR